MNQRIFPPLQLSGRISIKLVLFNCIYLLINLLNYSLCWVFIAAHGLSLVAASRGYTVLEHRLQKAGLRSCPTACGIFPDQVLNLRPPYWQANIQPLGHQESPKIVFFFFLTTQSFICLRPAVAGTEALRLPEGTEGGVASHPAPRCCLPHLASCRRWESR